MPIEGPVTELAPGDLLQLLHLSRRSGRRASGTWREVFGESAKAEEVFMAWYFARFVETLAASGKDAYELPMYVNAALPRPGPTPA